MVAICASKVTYLLRVCVSVRPPFTQRACTLITLSFWLTTILSGLMSACTIPQLWICRSALNSCLPYDRTAASDNPCPFPYYNHSIRHICADIIQSREREREKYMNKYYKQTYIADIVEACKQYLLYEFAQTAVAELKHHAEMSSMREIVKQWNNVSSRITVIRGQLGQERSLLGPRRCHHLVASHHLPRHAWTVSMSNSINRCMYLCL